METFLIRLWGQPTGEPDERLRGVLERVGAHGAKPFQDEAELLALLREMRSGRAADVVEAPADAAPRPDRL